MSSLQDLMQEQRQEGGVILSSGRDSRMEVVEVATGRVWLSVESANQLDLEALAEGLDESYRPGGVGVAVMDGALFQHSPMGEGSRRRIATRAATAAPTRS